MKDNRFDMLENAGDKNIERLSAHKVLTEKEKERILKMSIDKMNKKNENKENGIQVSGVERYSRPKWYGFAAAAACFVLVGSIIGTAVFLGRNGQTPDIDPLTTATTTTATGTGTGTAKTTSAATTTAAETTTESAGPDIEDKTAFAKSMLDELRQFDAVSSGAGVDIDHSTQETVERDGYSVLYNPITDSRFKSLDDVKAFFSRSFTQSFLSDHNYLWEGETPMFREINGRLCFIQAGRGGRFNFIGEPELLDITDDSCRIVSENEIAGGFRETITVNCIKADGTWKIDSYTSDEGMDETINAADLTAFHLDTYGALVFDKPVEEQNEATLKAAAKSLWESAARVAWSCNLYETALNDGATLPADVDGERFIEVNNIIYALVKDENVKTISDVIAGYHRLFSDKYPYDAAIDDCYIEQNGRVYYNVYAGQRGADISYSDSEIASCDGRDGNEMHFTVHDNYDDTQFGGEAYTENHEFTMVQGDDGVWRVGKYTLPY
ncbi:MAG: hypothetical protein Q4A05_01470 [Ruminococcus sp.]|nr:hypothetical protein [Ruminococcus sp.]